MNEKKIYTKDCNCHLIKGKKTMKTKKQKNNTVKFTKYKYLWDKDGQNKQVNRIVILFSDSYTCL